MWHRGCLRCTSCNAFLDSKRLNEKDGEPLCGQCYSKVCFLQCFPRVSEFNAIPTASWAAGEWVCPFGKSRWLVGREDVIGLVTRYYYQLFLHLCMVCYPSPLESRTFEYTSLWSEHYQVTQPINSYDAITSWSRLHRVCTLLLTLLQCLHHYGQLHSPFPDNNC